MPADRSRLATFKSQQSAVDQRLKNHTVDQLRMSRMITIQDLRSSTGSTRKTARMHQIVVYAATFSCTLIGGSKRKQCRLETASKLVRENSKFKISSKQAPQNKIRKSTYDHRQTIHDRRKTTVSRMTTMLP